SSLYDSDALGGYSIWNTGGSYKVSKTVKIRAGVLNLTDKNDAFLILHAVANDFQVLFEIEFKHAQWIAGVLNRRGDGH
ncbi:TonB-dependent receptor, partial [Pantoea agglomerans]|nr:TonB-dependent receptor [Pantoea agglomerans]